MAVGGSPGVEPPLTEGHCAREAERGRDTDEHWQSLVGTTGMEDLLSVMPVYQLGKEQWMRVRMRQASVKYLRR